MIAITTTTKPEEESVATDTVDALISAAWLQMRASTAADSRVWGIERSFIQFHPG